MDLLNHFYLPFANYWSTFGFSPLKHLIDLNDARSLAAIVAAVMAIRAAINKLGVKAIFKATISARLNRPRHISQLTISNLKDRPLVVYEVLALFDKSKAYVSVHTFDPPLVIRNLEATSFVPRPYSQLVDETDPFEELFPRFTLALVTEKDVVKCKQASINASLIARKLKGWRRIGTERYVFNEKVYTKEARYALIYPLQNGATGTSFLLASGFIQDDWPFRINALSHNDMQDEATVAAAVEVLAEQLEVNIQIVQLARNFGL